MNDSDGDPNASNIRLLQERQRLDFALAFADLGQWDLDLASHTAHRTLRHDQIFGYGSLLPEWTFEMFLDHVLPEERERVHGSFLAAVENDAVWELECPIRRVDGQVRWIWTKAQIYRDAEHRVERMLGIVGDITARKESAERERQILSEAAAANAKFRAFFEQGQLFAGIMAVDGTIIEANRLSWEGCGFTREQVTGIPFWAGPWWTPSKDLSEKIRLACEQAAGGIIFTAELPYFVADGSERMVDLVILPIKDEEGHTTFLVPTGTDITARKQAEAERQMFVSLAENSSDFIGFSDLDLVPVYINRAGLNLVGLKDIAQARAHTVPDFFFEDDRHEIMTKFIPTAIEKGHAETEVRFHNFETDKPRWMYFRVFDLHDANDDRVGLATVSTDISERREMEDHLRQLAADLSETNHRKDAFLATLAHELRNPLAPIRNALHMIELEKSDIKAAGQARSIIERQLEQMVRLIDDLTDLSRISLGKIALRTEQIELREVVSSAVESSRPLIEEMEHELTVTLPSEPLIINADLTRMAQVLLNLLNNAARYTERGGRIGLSAERQGNEVVVTVRDNGIGIDTRFLPQIFDMFSQVAPNLESKQGGLGIGLTLVQQLVQMHGGQVEARSEGQGHGAEFVVRIPAAEKVSATVSNDKTEPASPKAPLRVLNVDDNRDGADSMAMMLKILGHDTRTAYDGEQAVALASEYRPDVILLDIGLPKLNGYEVCREVRKMPWGKAMVIIAVTGWGQAEDRRKTADAGFDHHLVKPVEPKKLTALLATLTNKPAG